MFDLIKGVIPGFETQVRDFYDDLDWRWMPVAVAILAVIFSR